MVPYSYAKPGEIYGDFSPFSLHLDRSMASPLEVRGIEQNPGSLTIPIPHFAQIHSTAPAGKQPQNSTFSLQYSLLLKDNEL